MKAIFFLAFTTFLIAICIATGNQPHLEANSEAVSKSSEETAKENTTSDKEEENSNGETNYEPVDSIHANKNEENMIPAEIVSNVSHSTLTDTHGNHSSSTADNDLAIHVQFEDEPSVGASNEIKGAAETADGLPFPADQIPAQPKDEVLIRKTRETSHDEKELEVDSETAQEKVELLSDENESVTTVVTKVYNIKVDAPLKADVDYANTSYGPTVSLLDGPGIEEIGIASENASSEEYLSKIPVDALIITKRKGGQNETEYNLKETNNVDNTVKQDSLNATLIGVSNEKDAPVELNLGDDGNTKERIEDAYGIYSKYENASNVAESIVPKKLALADSQETENSTDSSGNKKLYFDQPTFLNEFDSIEKSSEITPNQKELLTEDLLITSNFSETNDDDRFYSKNVNPYQPEFQEKDDNATLNVDHRISGDSIISDEQKINDYNVLDNLRDDVDAAEKQKSNKAASDSTGENNIGQQKEYTNNQPGYRYLTTSEADKNHVVIIKETRNKRQSIYSKPPQFGGGKEKVLHSATEVDESNDNDLIAHGNNEVNVTVLLNALADAMEKDLELNEEAFSDSEASDSYEHHGNQRSWLKTLPQEDERNSQKDHIDKFPEAETIFIQTEDEYEPIIIPMHVSAEDRTHFLSNILGIVSKDDEPVMIEPEGVRNGFGPGTNTNLDNNDDVIRDDNPNSETDDVVIVGAKTAVIEITKKITLIGDESDNIETVETSVQTPPLDPDHHHHHHEPHSRSEKNFLMTISISPFMLIFTICAVLILVSVKILRNRYKTAKVAQDNQPPVYTAAPPVNSKIDENKVKEITIDVKN